MLTPKLADVIIPLHIITGCDHTSGFYGHGNKTILDKTMRDPTALELLHRVGEGLDITNDVKANMKTFVISKIYSENGDSCGQARASKWHKLKQKCTIRLPPD